MNTTTKQSFEGYQTTTGSKFVAGRDVTQIAKLIRADIKALSFQMSTVSEFAGAKFSVKASRYSMGQSITVTISGMHRGQAADTVRSFAQAIVDSYNDRETNWQSDYCRQEFSGSVSMDYTTEVQS